MTTDEAYQRGFEHGCKASLRTMPVPRECEPSPHFERYSAGFLDGCWRAIAERKAAQAAAKPLCA